MSENGRRGLVAVVTGAGGGVGRACARRLAGTHALVLAEAHEDRLQALERELHQMDARITAVHCDVSKADDVAELARITAAEGGFDALVHTAGLSRSMADGPRIVEVNLIGTALLLSAFLALASDGSVAVCISSIGAHRAPLHQLDGLLDPYAPEFLEKLEAHVPLRGRSGLAYDLSKRGVVLLCERSAAAWGRRGARIVSLSPGPIATPMGELEARRDARGLDAVSAFGRAAEPQEVAAVAAMLCGPDASYVTGCDLRVDGGVLAGIEHHASAEVRAGWHTLRSERSAGAR